MKQLEEELNIPTGSKITLNWMNCEKIYKALKKAYKKSEEDYGDHLADIGCEEAADKADALEAQEDD